MFVDATNSSNGSSSFIFTLPVLIFFSIFFIFLFLNTKIVFQQGPGWQSESAICNPKSAAFVKINYQESESAISVQSETGLIR